MHTIYHTYAYILVDTSITMELKEKYKEAWEEVMNNPIRHLWDNMEEDRKELILIGITNNMGLKNE